MDNAKAKAPVDRSYEDFQPATKWVQEKGYQTYVVHLSGFRKEQLKVQVTSTKNMRVSGERPLGNHKWSRFKEECAIPSDCDINSISAKFEGGMLYVKLPKKTNIETPQQKKEEPKPANEATKESPKKAHQGSNGQEHETRHHPQPVASAARKVGNQADKKINNTNTKQEEEETLGRLASTSGGRVELGKLKRSATDLAMRLKRPKALMNLAVCVVIVGVIMVYVMDAMRSLGKPRNTLQ